MKTLVHILVVSDEEAFIKRLTDSVTHSQVNIDSVAAVSDNAFYDFYVLASSKIVEAIDKIRELNTNSFIYLSGLACKVNIPIKKIFKCNIVGCIENEEDLKEFANKVNCFRKQKSKIHEASFKLDSLKSGDLKALTKQLKKTESEKFVDYIQNHPLPIVLVSCECEVLHANAVMENMIGSKLPGINASTYWDNIEEFNIIINELKKEGQLLGRKVTLKNIYGERLLLRLYTSLHYDKEGNWLNTRCLFVPIEQNPLG